MENKLENEESPIYYLLALRDVLLSDRNEIVEELIVEKYNEKLKKIEKLFNINLNPYKIDVDDLYAKPTERYNPIGFTIDDTTSTVSSKISEENNTLKYKKFNVLLKINQMMLIIKDLVKK